MNCGTMASGGLQSTQHTRGHEVALLLDKEIRGGAGYFTTDSQSVCLGIEYPCKTCDQILLPVGMLLSEICGLVSVGRPL
jgi:hypothetical protein